MYHKTDSKIYIAMAEIELITQGIGSVCNMKLLKQFYFFGVILLLIFNLCCFDLDNYYCLNYV